MDEEPECSRNIDVDPTKKDQSESQKDQLILPDEINPADITKTVLIKDHAASSAVETTSKSPAVVAVLAIDQPIHLIDQPKFSKAKPRLAGDRPTLSQLKTAFSENQPSHSKHQPDHSIDQPTFSKTQTEDKPASATSLTKLYIDVTNEESTSSRELIVEPNVSIDTKQNELFSKEQKTLILRNYATASAAPSLSLNKEYFLSTNVPLKINSSHRSPNKNDPTFPMLSTVTLNTQQTSKPTSLFLLAKSKLNESSSGLALVPFKLRSSSHNLSKICHIESGSITPPDSLTSAPPTYSFVLRQMAIRRRPRFMGTFFPSPSFVSRAPHL